MNDEAASDFGKRNDRKSKAKASGITALSSLAMKMLWMEKIY